MKCRRINPENGMIVWFGVKDVKKENDIIIPTFQNESNKHDNYAKEAEGVVNSLRERLSIIKHELWYDYENGIPLLDKIRSKATIDAYIIQKVLEHPDVIEIEGFESEQSNHKYECYMIVNTIYGQIELGL